MRSGSRVLRLLVITFFSNSGRKPSVITCVCSPRSLLPSRYFRMWYGQVAEPDLKGGAVVDQLGDVVPDAPQHLVVLRRGEGLDQRFLVQHEVIDFVHVDEAVAPGARHARVDLRDHQPGVVQPRAGDVHRNPQAAVPELVRRADLDQGHVQADPLAGEQAGDSGKVGRECSRSCPRRPPCAWTG